MLLMDAGSPLKVPHMCHDRWKTLHHATYKATVIKNGMHSGTTKQHWPSDLSKICFDTFQPEWIQQFDARIPRCFRDLEEIVLAKVNRFHDVLAKHIPDIASVRDGISFRE